MIERFRSAIKPLKEREARRQEEVACLRGIQSLFGLITCSGKAEYHLSPQGPVSAQIRVSPAAVEKALKRGKPPLSDSAKSLVELLSGCQFPKGLPVEFFTITVTDYNYFLGVRRPYGDKRVYHLDLGVGHGQGQEAQAIYLSVVHDDRGSSRPINVTPSWEGFPSAKLPLATGKTLGVSFGDTIRQTEKPALASELIGFARALIS